MRSLALAAAALAVLPPAPAAAQGNDDDYTPLNSRIKRDRQFPTDLPSRWQQQTSAVSRSRSEAMRGQFSHCLYTRSREDALELLDKTDLGFADFAQVNMANERAARIYGVRDCLSRVARTQNSGVMARFGASTMRQWMVEEAYFDRYAGGPSWVKPGNVIAPREYPLSGSDIRVTASLDLADCIVASDPYTADFFFRTAQGSAEEGQALQALVPSLGPCLPQGVQWELEPTLLRLWLGEALWHAANHSAPAPAVAQQDPQ